MYGKEEEVDDELVDKTSPYCGTRTFGMCYVNQRGEMALTGCALEVENFVKRSDGTMSVICRVSTYTIIIIIQEKGGGRKKKKTYGLVSIYTALFTFVSSVCVCVCVCKHWCVPY